MYFKNRLIPKYADDYPYSFIWEGDRNGNLAFGRKRYKRVKNLRDLIRSQVSHYKTWDGRAIAESLVQLFLIKDDKKHFDRANTAVMLLQLLLCASLGTGKPAGLKDISPKKALLLTAGFFASAPNLIASCFWLTGAMNYLWMGIPQSSFVLPYSMDYLKGPKKMPPALMFFTGLLSGWSTETGAGAAMMLSGLETVYALKQKRYSSWMGWGLAGSLLGMLLLLLAPGNRKKLHIEQNFSDTLPETLEDSPPGYIPVEYLYTPEMFKKWLREGFLPTVLRELPLQIPVIMYFLKGRGRDTKSDLYILALEAAVFAVPSVMMLSPEYPRRATYPSVIYLLAAAFFASEHLDIPDYAKWDPLFKAAGSFAALLFFLNLSASLIVDADISRQINDQIRYIMNNKGRNPILLENVFGPPFYQMIAGDRSITWDLTMGVCLDNADDPYNMAAAAYYGADALCCDDFDRGDHVYEQKDLSSVVFSIINPLKSFIIRTWELLSGKPRGEVLPDTIYYPIKKYVNSEGCFYIYDKPLKESSTPLICSLRTGTGGTELLRLKALAERHQSHIDLLKLYMEDPGSEVLEALGKMGLDIDQIFIETHGRFHGDGDQKNVSHFETLRKLGYILIYADSNKGNYTFLKQELRAPFRDFN